MNCRRYEEFVDGSKQTAPIGKSCIQMAKNYADQHVMEGGWAHYMSSGMMADAQVAQVAGDYANQNAHKFAFQYAKNYANQTADDESIQIAGDRSTQINKHNSILACGMNCVQKFCVGSVVKAGIDTIQTIVTHSTKFERRITYDEANKWYYVLDGSTFVLVSENVKNDKIPCDINRVNAQIEYYMITLDINGWFKTKRTTSK